MKKYVLFYLLSITSVYTHAQESARLSKQEYLYKIDTAKNSFYKRIVINGYHQQEKFIYSIYFGELDLIKSVTAYTNTFKKRSKLPKQNHFQSRVLNNNFYSGLSSYNLQFEHKNASSIPQWFSIEMEQESKEIIRLASLNFYKSSKQRVDTIIHEVIVPQSHVLYYSHLDASKILNLKIDSIQRDDLKIYRFEKIFSAKESLDSNYFEGIRCMVTKSNTSAYQNLNNWYYDMIQNIQLSDNYKTICDSITRNTIDSSSIIKSIYDYVKNSIRYIDIENGINAFKPRACDEVLYNKYGDCKDMAFLIQKMLIHKGIQANLALSSTSSHDFQFNFPSIASANHLICVAILNEKKYYLDATEKYGMYTIPSRQIINTSAFIIDQKHYKIISIPKSEPQTSSVKRTYELNVTESGINGNVKIICTGYNKIELESLISYTSKSQLNKVLERYCNQKGYNTQYTNFKIDKTESTIEVSAEIAIKTTVLSRIQNKAFLDLSFLPNPLPYFGKLDTIAREVDLTYNQSYETIFTIYFDKQIEKINSPFKNFDLKNDDLNFEFNIHRNNNALEIKYSLITQKEKYSKNEFNILKNYSTIIASTLNHEISIH